MSELFFIPISGLKEGHSLYDFEIGNKFFEDFEESEIKEGNLSASIALDKRSSHFDIIFKIKGEVKICCDRCLDAFLQPIECENRLLVKFGAKWDENDPDIITVPADEYELNIKQYLYEFIYLALPIQRIHPENKNGESTCDPEMIKMLKQHIVNDEKMNDPRWDELKKLLNKN
jgi:uncharacterized metal-binding protein YceD (DUF177 family)